MSALLAVLGTAFEDYNPGFRIRGVGERGLFDVGGVKGPWPGWAKHGPGKDCVLAAALGLGPGGAGIKS